MEGVFVKSKSGGSYFSLLTFNNCCVYSFDCLLHRLSPSHENKLVFAFHPFYFTHKCEVVWVGKILKKTKIILFSKP
jgi:hypothetical protein